jgi:hypothetical protein
VVHGGPKGRTFRHGRRRAVFRRSSLLGECQCIRCSDIMAQRPIHSDGLGHARGAASGPPFPGLR